MKLPLIFDCDTGIDDALALMYGAHHGANFVACTVTHGNVPVEVGSRNTVTVLDFLGKQEVPVFSGAARPLAQPLRTAEAVHGEDGLGDAKITPSARALSGDQAAAVIVRLARENPGKLSLVAVGPLTNIAIALLLEPQLPALIKNVVIMGGAVGVPGNASAVAEANIWHDPEAAQVVIDAAWDVLFVGLEITLQTALTAQAVRQIEKSTDPRAQFAANIMDFYLESYEKSFGYRTCVLHDPLALALALEPQLAEYRLVQAKVELRGSISRGQIVSDQRMFLPTPTNPKAPGVIRIVQNVDIAGFHTRFLSALGVPEEQENAQAPTSP
ncbi:nucleoside hydrolase [Lysinibacter sp. HNR]|uniref:nucleoside hydrolase n=1 Tax=Lysinibacter sp. HNR TaxID=3031408 RepID=UPI002434A068|nr:nucleoside hydrolase [Lysinibacter sp. HNR]WGD38267.1 nucleoside hydrolase [Lysinibacter sp. HNR]